MDAKMWISHAVINLFKQDHSNLVSSMLSSSIDTVSSLELVLAAK